MCSQSGSWNRQSVRTIARERDVPRPSKLGDKADERGPVEGGRGPGFLGKPVVASDRDPGSRRWPLAGLARIPGIITMAGGVVETLARRESNNGLVDGRWPSRLARLTRSMCLFNKGLDRVEVLQHIHIQPIREGLRVEPGIPLADHPEFQGSHHVELSPRGGSGTIR